MKKVKKVVALFTAALLCLLPIFSNVLTAEAEGTPTTYYVKYVDAKNEWRFQYESWNDSEIGRDMYYLTEGIKDGDLLVIDGNTDLQLSVNVKLKNLTVVHSPAAIISAPSIDEVYVINDSTTAVTGDVGSASVYGNGVANFNSNVGNLYIITTNDNDDPDANVAVVGTVDYVKGHDKSSTYYEGYNFKANALRVENGHLKADAGSYSTTPSATPSAPTAPSAGTTTTTPSASEYDDVPKTGDFFVNPCIFLGLAFLCLVGNYKLNKK